MLPERCPRRARPARGVTTIVTGVEDAKVLTMLWHLAMDDVQGGSLQPSIDSLVLSSV